MSTDLEWYKEIWEEFLNIPLDESENWTKIHYFIWPEETDVDDILDWFRINTDYKLPPDTGYTLKWEGNTYCDNCECDPCECEDNSCPECDCYDCICECEHEHINQDGECENCYRDMQDDCPHHNIEEDECTRCHIDSSQAEIHREDDRRRCRERNQHMQSTYIEDEKIYCVFCDQLSE